MSLLQVITRTCPVCKNTIHFTVDHEAWEAYCAGAPIHRAFPDLDPIRRESITSGVCSDACWDNLYGGLEDEGEA